MPGPKLTQPPTNMTRRSTRVGVVQQNSNISTAASALGKIKSGIGLSKLTSNRKNENAPDPNKRKAEKSPNTKVVKRSAFIELTNEVQKIDVGKPSAKTTMAKKPSVTTVVKRPPLRSTTNTIATVVPQKKPHIKQTIKSHIIPSATTRKAVEVKQPVVKKVVEDVSKKVIEPQIVAKAPLRRSARLSATAGDSSGESFYVTALEELNITNSDKKSDAEDNKQICLPPGVEDFDKECGDDPSLVSVYAFDIFNYLKSRELKYTNPGYMHKQGHINKYMRSVLVDWLVDVQENFELNHETLYLSVRMVDKYLSKRTTSRDTLQLVGAASMFIAAKYEERCPPSVDEMVFVCDNAYTKQQLLMMEESVLKALDFDLGFPLSYSFLRRYARCAKMQMPRLTLARYVLEYSLMDYNTVTMSESKLAAASLHIARKMDCNEGWTPTLEYHSGYKFDDFKDIAIYLNDLLHKKPKEDLTSIRIKYSQDIFFEVAKTPLVGNEKL